MGIASDYLYLVHKLYQIKVYSFVLMDNHFHLLVSAPKKNLSEAIGYFLAEWSKELVRIGNRTNHTWAHRFKSCEISDLLYLQNAYKYVYRNPVDAGLCESVLDYRFSTIHSLVGRSKLFIPLEHDFFLFDYGTEYILNWLDKSPNKENYKSVSLALRKRKFAFSKENSRKNKMESSLM